MIFNPDSIKPFVRSSLGCSCPDDVFFRIRFEKDYKIKTDLVIDRIITIGDRLLIFVKIADSYEQIKNHLEYLIEQGKSWRDCEDLNRFRLVVGSSEPTKIEKKIFALFKKLKNIDDNVHLHVISMKELHKYEII